MSKNEYKCESCGAKKFVNKVPKGKVCYECKKPKRTRTEFTCFGCGTRFGPSKRREIHGAALHCHECGNKIRKLGKVAA